MTPIEVAARVRLEIARRLCSRRPPLPPDLAARPAFRSPYDAAVLRRAFEDAGLAAATVAEAERVLAGGFTLFGGFTVNAPGGVPDWFAAFPSGARWDDAARSFDIDISGRDGRDVRFTWELSRHGDLVALARAALLTGEARYAGRLAALLAGWLDANPFLRGPNWTSALEAGVRGIAWAFIDDCLAGAGLALGDDALRRRFLEAMFLHGAYVERFSSRGLNPSNHIIGEAAGLFVLGTKLSATEAGRRWRARARRILEAEIARQTFPSGASREQSTSYHRFVTALFGLCLAVAGDRGFSPRFRERLRAMYLYLDSIARPDGSFAHLGDSDDAVALRLSEPRPDDLAGDLALGAALFPDMDIRLRPVSPQRAGQGGSQPALFADAYLPARRATPEVLWLCGPRRRNAPSPVTPRPRQSVLVGGAGLAVMRSASGVLQVELDCGPQGYSPVASHGHADALSVTLWRNGSRIIDPGTYRYNGAPEQRNAFRSAALHNTVTVDGRSQAEPASPFSWLTLAAAAPARVYLSSDFDCAAGTLGPAAGRPWAHRREVMRYGDDLVFVIDTVSCRGGHAAVARFHLGGAKVTLDGATARVKYPDRREMTMYSLSDGVALETSDGRWSPSYGVMAASSTVAGKVDFTGEAVLRWLIVLNKGYTLRPLALTIGAGAAVEITAAGTDGRLVFLSLPSWNLAHLEDIRFIGRWGLFEFESGALTRAWGAQNWVVDHAGNRLFTNIGNTGIGIVYRQT